MLKKTISSRKWNFTGLLDDLSLIEVSLDLDVSERKISVNCGYHRKKKILLEKHDIFSACTWKFASAFLEYVRLA